MTAAFVVGLLTLLVTLGCDSDGCGGGEYMLPPLARSHGDAGSPDSDAASKQEPRRAPHLKIAIIDAPPLPMSRATRGRLLSTGGHLSLQGVAERPPRALVGRSVEVDGEAERIQLIDIDDGHVLGEVARIRQISEEAGVVRGWNGAPPTPVLLRLEDGVLLHPIPRGPEGARLEEPVILLDEESPQVLLFARGADGTTRYGRWQDLANEEVILHHVTPLSPLTYRWNAGAHGYEVQRGWGSPERVGTAEDECVRARTPATGGSICRAWGDPTATRPDDFEQSWLTQGWITESSSGYTMAFDTSTGERQWLAPPRCPARLVAVLPAPPRVLVGCVGGGTGRTYSIWRPGASVLFDLDLAENQHIRGAGTITHPIMPATMLDWSTKVASLWVDLEQGVVHDTPPLRPLNAGSQRRITFASRRTRDGLELLRLDFDARTLTTLATYDDCDGVNEMGGMEGILRLLDHREPRVAIACLRQRGDHDADELLWTEIIDVELGRRWRTSAMVERLLLEDVVLASDRRGTADLSTRTATSLFVLDLLD